MLQVLDLFSGIGGFSLGLERTGGFETVAFCEIDPFCRKVLAKHWPGVPIHEDVKALHGNVIGPVDVVCGGFPCQPFSVAGKQQGAEDDRYLWPEMHRIVDECRPTWFIGENVAGIGVMALDQVLSDLEKLDYTTRSIGVPACALNAPHERFRWFILAHTERPRLERYQQKRARLCEPTSTPSTKCRNRGIYEGTWESGPCVTVRMANGFSRPVDRLKALGNAVVPQVVEVIGRAIMEAA